MPSEIDRIGVFRGKPVETGVGQTRNGFPQFVARLAATQKYVEDAEEMTAFGLTEAGWVDWSSYEQEMVGYFVLIGGAGTPLLNFEQVQKALGWDGGSFAALATGDYSAKEVLFRVEENEYNGVTSLKVSWIDEPNAPINPGLRALDAAGLTNLDAKFGSVLMASKKSAPAAAPAKAAAKPPTAGKPAPGKAVASAAPAKGPPAKPAATPPAASSPAKSASPSKGPPKTAAPAAEAAPFDEALDQNTAWAQVEAKRGKATDDQLAEAWLDASAAMAPGKDEDSMTAEEWGKIRDDAIARIAKL